jgi:hypothetical protein
LRIRRPIGVENRRRIYRFVEDSRRQWGVEDAALSPRDFFNGLLDVQLDLGIRSIELDVHADPQGGLYSEPGGYKAMATIGLRPNTAFDPRGVLQRPGLQGPARAGLGLHEQLPNAAYRAGDPLALVGVAFGALPDLGADQHQREDGAADR